MINFPRREQMKLFCTDYCLSRVPAQPKFAKIKRPDSPHHPTVGSRPEGFYCCSNESYRVERKSHYEMEINFRLFVTFCNYSSTLESGRFSFPVLIGVQWPPDRNQLWCLHSRNLIISSSNKSRYYLYRERHNLPSRCVQQDGRYCRWRWCLVNSDCWLSQSASFAFPVNCTQLEDPNREKLFGRKSQERPTTTAIFYVMAYRFPQI